MTRAKLPVQCTIVIGAGAILPVSIRVALFSAADMLAHSELGRQSNFLTRLMLEGDG
jgi:hypothetical protein